MAGINLSLNLSAVLSATVGTIARFDVLTEDASGNMVLANTANLAGGRLPRCIATAPSIGGQTVPVQQFGPVPGVVAPFAGPLGETFAVVDAAGHIQRSITLAPGALAVGWIGQDGTLYCNFVGRSSSAGGAGQALPDGMVYVTDYGYIPDSDGVGGGTDNADAIEAADAAAGNGGRVIFPKGRAYCSRTVRKLYHSMWEGVSAGPAVFYPGTQLDFAAGKVGIRVENGGMAGPILNGGSGSTIDGFTLYSIGRNTNKYLGTYNNAITDTTVAGATASVTTGSPIVTVTGDTSFFYQGQNVTIPGYMDGPGGVLPAFSVVLGISGQELTMSYASTGTATGQPLIAHEVMVTLSAPGDFAVGDMIAIPGAGPPMLIMGGHAQCTTTAGNPVVTVDNCPDGVPLLPPGQYFGDSGNWVTIPGSGATETPTEVIATDNIAKTFTLATAPTLSVSGFISYCPHLISRISQVRNGGLTICITSEEGGVSMNGIPVLMEHAECGIDASVQTFIRNCFIGGRASPFNPGGGCFQGAGIAIYGDHSGNVPSTNANVWLVENTYCIGNRHAIDTLGQDAQVGRAIGMHSIASRNWGIHEASQVGNTYIACGADGNFGYMTASGPNKSTIVNCYTEGGCLASFGASTTIVGGIQAFEAGGNSWVAGIMNHLQVGSGYSKHQTHFDPYGSFIRCTDSTNAAGANGLALRIAGPGDGLGPVGWYLWAHDTGSRSYAMLMADNNTPAPSQQPGTVWFPRGFMLGDNSDAHWLDPANVECRRIESRRGIIGFGGVFNDPSTGVTSTGWDVGDTVRDTLALDGYTLRTCMRAGHRAPEWAANAVHAVGNVVCPTIEGDTGDWYICTTAGTSAASEPTWGAATVAEGPDTLVWTKQASGAAYFQAAGMVGGYIKKSVAGAANVTLAQTDKEFLTESIECTGVITANVDLILPLGRYRRWVFNNTTGAFAFRVKCASGNAVTIATGTAAWVICNGTEMRRQSADLAP